MSRNKGSKVCRVKCYKKPSSFLLIAEHAGDNIPLKFNNLGLSDRDRKRHISYDIGIEEVCEITSSLTLSTAILSIHSRLLVDLNRREFSKECILARSDGTVIAGNSNLSELEKNSRVREFHKPFHDLVSETIEYLKPSMLLSLHSFTPKLDEDGVKRPWHCGILYGEAKDLGQSCLKFLKHNTNFVVGDNEPYGVNKKSGYTISVHGDEKTIPAIILEIRQDLIEDKEGQNKWGQIVTSMMKSCFK